MNTNQNPSAKYKKFTDYKTLKEDIGTELWTEIYNSQNVNEMMDSFIQKIKTYIFKHTKNIRIKNNKNKIRKKWITPEIMQL